MNADNDNLTDDIMPTIRESMARVAEEQEAATQAHAGNVLSAMGESGASPDHKFLRHKLREATGLDEVDFTDGLNRLYEHGWARPAPGFVVYTHEGAGEFKRRRN